MTAWIVVESMYGNTRKVADVVADGLRERMPVEVVDVNDAHLVVPDDVTLVVVAGPTHMLGMSRPRTRHEAKKAVAYDEGGTGIRDWLEVASMRSGLPAAAFDTKVDRLTAGSAANAASRRLRRLGCTVIAKPRSFFVEGTEGPLLSGEVEHARQYASELISDLERRGLIASAA